MIFRSRIVKGLAEHPEWLRTALDAVASGMNDAVVKARERANAKDVAMISALGLLHTDRLSAETKRCLNELVARGINPDNASEIEKRALKAAGQDT